MCAGSAPVVDSCGLAGGTPWKPDVAEWGTYVKTTHAEHGDYGTKVLPYTPTGREWKIGGTAEVTWQITANHGGGYQVGCPRRSTVLSRYRRDSPFQLLTPPTPHPPNTTIYADPIILYSTVSARRMRC